VNQVTGLAKKPHAKPKQCPKIGHSAPAPVQLERPQQPGDRFIQTKGEQMKQVQRGFTLIELVMVIVILGVLAAVAIPKFVDLKGEAETAALQGVVGGVSSASAVNYAARSANGSKGTATQGLSCQAAATAIMQSGVPNGYTLATAGTLAAGSNNCVITQTSTAGTATAVIIGVN
jgi:prepilin-type N-terminal cleavage/methylation domain-containing protein